MTKIRSLLRRLQAVDTAAICDADKGLRLNTVKVMAPRIVMRTPLQVNNKTMVGVARTVQLIEPNDFLPVLQGLSEAKKGEILCVDTKNSTKAVVGGLFLTEAERKGLKGIIVDGPVRDIATMKGSSIYCYSSSVTPYSGSITQIGNMQVPIKCGDVQVNSGDIIIADGDGVIVSDADSLDELVDVAEQIVKKEAEIFKIMKSGKSLDQCSNLHEHIAALKSGKDSSLKFH